eukprot:8657587-Karenia_brevis.AAC.1
MLILVNLEHKTRRSKEGETEHEVHIPEGNNQARQTHQMLHIKPEEWLDGPDGWMSLGDMPTAAGHPVDMGNRIPPPPAGPIPDDY